jgi:hypothetical protein
LLDVFDLRGRVIGEYAAFSRSFTRVAAPDIAAAVEAEYARAVLARAPNPDQP